MHKISNKKNIFAIFLFATIFLFADFQKVYAYGSPDYLPNGSHPRIWLTDSELARMREAKVNNTAEWQAFNAWLTSNYPATNYAQKCPSEACSSWRSINWDGHSFGSYRGLGWLENITNYALAYQIFKTVDPDLALQYGNQCIEIVNGMIATHSVGEETTNGILMMRAGDGTYNLTNNSAEVTAATNAGEYIMPTYRDGKYGYPTRAMMALPLAYDWLYELLTPQERILWQSVMFRYFDWTRGVTSEYNNGVLYGGIRYHEQNDGTCNGTTDVCTTAVNQKAASWEDQGDNFYSGHFAMMSLIGVATYGDSPNAAGYYNYAKTEMWENKVKAYWNDPTFGKGGDAVEGWNYGGGFFREYEALWGMNTATGYNFFSETNHPTEVIQSYINANASNLTDMYNHGQWSGSSIGKPYQYHILLPKFVLQKNGETNYSSIAQSYINNATFAAQANEWENLLFNVSQNVLDYKTLPLYYWSQGSGLFSFHSTWENQVDSISSWFQLGYGTRSTHENYDEGSFQIMRGNDKLIWDAGLQRDEWRQSVLRFGVSGITGSQRPFGTAWVLSDSILRQEHNSTYDYIQADLRGGYQKNYYSSKTAATYLKDVLYIRPNMYVIYDITRTDPTNTNKWKDWQTQYPGIPVMDDASQTITFSNGSSKVFTKTLYPSVVYTTALESGAFNYVKAQPTVVQEYDQFLHVIEATSSTDSQTMATLISGSGGRGVLIMDPEENILAMFTSDQNGADIANLSYSVDTSASSRHIIANLTPNQNYNISIDGQTPVQYIASSSGIIEFTNVNSGSHTFTITSESLDSTSPASPSGLAVF